VIVRLDDARAFDFIAFLTMEQQSKVSVT
jgi:hypothetical protein